MALIKRTFFLLIVLAVGGAGGLVYWSMQALPTSTTPEKAQDFTIKPGSGLRSASRQIRDAGVPLNPYLFELLVRVSGKAGQLKAGSFEFAAGDTPTDLLRKISNGEFSHASLAVIEGWSFKQMRAVVDANPAIKHDTAAWSAQQIMHQIDPEFDAAEGLFFPDTYVFAKGSSDLEIYQLAHQAMRKRLEQAWQERATDLPYKTPYEALIMASIIEKETGQAVERDMVAAVFVNRLRAGMLLQTDPTVIYGMGDKYNGKIRKIDLQTDTPYNTYTRSGLPPTPIALPGAASLIAALNPAKSNVVYFVAKGDGTSHFSTSLDEHNRAVNKFQR
ncbi:MAG: endolytic transglycosylase MltG [Burkholderiaceae bacterium]|nr:endolytic transglycosylase MltG [Burkholderiaceae bacterium]